jgi:hypothetical protein
VDRTGPARRRVGVGGGDVRRRGAAQTDGELRSRNRAFPCRSGCRLASGRVALRGIARSAPALRPCLLRALARASTVSRGWRARNIHLGGRRGTSSGCDGDRVGPGWPPRTEFVAVGDAHEVVVPRGLKVQAPEPDFEPGWEGVRAAHGTPMAAVLGANHHREGWWELIFSAIPLPGAPTVGVECSPDTN